MFKRRKKGKVVKVKHRYIMPQKPTEEWTLSEIKAACEHYSDNHEKCPLRRYDEYAGFCFVKSILWGCND